MKKSELMSLYNDSKRIPDRTPNQRWKKFYEVVRELKSRQNDFSTSGIFQKTKLKKSRSKKHQRSASLPGNEINQKKHHKRY